MTLWVCDHTQHLVNVESFELLEFNLSSPVLMMVEGREEPKTLKNLFSPITINPTSCIALPTTIISHFELKPQVITLLPNFYGLDREDPYMHIKDFLEICATFKFQNFFDESVRLRLFPFSLKDKAKAWLNSLSALSITSWDMLVTKVLGKFFPMAKINTLMREIADFSQDEIEVL